jgi:hypothetical protein
MRVEKVQDEGLTREVWDFYFTDLTMLLDIYRYDTRLSRRHKWSNQLIYKRIMNRNSTMEEENVVIPPEVEAEVLKIIRDRITVKKWSERYK